MSQQTATHPPVLQQAVSSAPAKSRVFTGYFKHRNTPPMNYSFNFNGTLKEAKERWRLHCERMGYIYIQCVPAIIDLDHREKLRNDNSNDFNIDD